MGMLLAADLPIPPASVGNTPSRRSSGIADFELLDGDYCGARIVEGCRTGR